MRLLPVHHFLPSCLHLDFLETIINPLGPHTEAHLQTTLLKECPLHPNNSSTISLSTRSLGTSTQTTVAQASQLGLIFLMSVTSHHQNMALSGQIRRVQVTLKGLSITTALHLLLRQGAHFPVLSPPLSAASWPLPTLIHLWVTRESTSSPVLVAHRGLVPTRGIHMVQVTLHISGATRFLMIIMGQLPGASTCISTSTTNRAPSSSSNRVQDNTTHIHTPCRGILTPC